MYLFIIHVLMNIVSGHPIMNEPIEATGKSNSEKMPWSMIKKLAIGGGSLGLMVAAYFLSFPPLYAVAGLALIYLFSSSCGG